MSQRPSLPLSSTQQAVWLDQLLAPELPCYNVGGALQFDGHIRLDLWECAIAEVVRRNDALRLVLVDQLPVAGQKLLDDVGFKLERHDYSVHADGEQRAWKHVREAFLKPFSLYAGVLWEMQWVQATATRGLCLVRCHHLVADGASVALILHAIIDCYNSLVRGEPLGSKPAPSYLDFIADDLAYQQSARWSKDQEFWFNRFSESPDSLNPAGTPPGRRATQQVVWEIDRAEFSHMAALGVHAGSSITHVLIGAVAIYCSRISGDRPDIVIGMPVHNRKNAAEKRTVGMFSSMLPLTVAVDAQASFESTLRALAAQSRACYRHQRFPLYEITRHTQSRSPDRSRLFDLTVSVEQFPVDFVIEGGRIVMVPQHNGFEDVPLALYVRDYERSKSVRVEFNFDPQVLSREEVLAAVRRIERMLQAAVDAPQTPVRQLPLLDERERWQVLHGWNGASQSSPDDACVHGLFERQVARTPDATALVFEDCSLSYAELNARANRLAHHLIALGVTPDTQVAIALPRGIDMIVALLATLKAGGAYVPLDPAHPAGRLAYMLDDSSPCVLITDTATSKFLGEMAASPAVLQLDVDRAWQSLPAVNPDAAALGITPSHLAYVIYTSGSTGQPKAVMVEHRSVLHLWAGLERDIYAHHPGIERVSLNASLAFDASVQQWVQLASGRTLVIVPDAARRDAATLLDLIAACRIDTFDCTPSQLHLMRSAPPSATWRAPAVALVGGEAIDADLWRTLTGSIDTTYYNVYGPTECTVDSTIARIQAPASAPHIGHPIANTRVYILDGGGEPVPLGVIGEIHIGSAGVARGFLRRPELTADRFVPDPFATIPGSRMYKTGDLGRWRPDGTIEFLGRNDQQVKIRGFRIEPGEIEARLREHPGVREAVVLARDDAPGERQLVAYVAGNVVLPPQTLREHLAARLPAYMLPAAFVQLDALPLLPNGKLDRRALPAPNDLAFSARAYEPPHDGLEAVLAAMWSELLGRERIGRHDHFFEMGGHSLLAVQLVSRVRARLGREIPTAELFAHPTLASYAQRVGTASASTLPAIVPASRHEPLPLSFAQQRLWFLAQLDPRAATAYLMPGAIRLRGRLDVIALRSALDRIVARHEALRTCFVRVDGTAMQVIGEADAGFALEQVHLSGHAEPEAEFERVAREEANTPFDLEQGPLIRGRLLHLAADDHVLLVTMHHIVSDGWSTGLLIDEFAALYTACTEGRSDPLPALPVQYADYAVWQRRWISGDVLQRQLGFWREHLSGAPALLELPTDRPRPPVQDHAGASLPFKLHAELSAALKDLSRRHGTTLFMTLLASWAALLARLSGQDEVVIGTPVANRHRTEIEPLIGFFVNTLALRIDLSGQPSVAQLLAQVRGTALAAHAHQDVPYEEVVEALNPPRSLAHSPVFQVMFAWQNAPEAALELPGLRVELMNQELGTAKFDLEVSMHEDSECIVGHIGYATALFDGSTIQRHLDCWQTLLRSMVADDSAPVPRLPLLPDAERHQLLHGWNATDTVSSAGHCIHELFEAQVARTPEAVALVCEETTLSYAELNARANRLAHHLIALGITPDDPVALALPRGTEMVVALLATLKAGGAYVPLDPDYPSERLAYTLADSAARVLLTTTGVRGPGALPPSLTVLELDAAMRPWETAPTTNPAPATLGLRPTHLAYVIYTSGSTGTPKGVMVEHAQVVRLFSATRAWFEFGANDVWTLFHSYAFDFSVWELWGALLHGGRLVVVPQHTARSPKEFHALLCDHGVTVLNQTPSAFRQLITAQAESELVHHLRCVIFGGEALEPATLAPWYARNGERTQLINMYGITETTVHVSYRPLTPEDTRRSASPIGVPIPDLRVVLLDVHGQPVPIGVTGELYVGGAGVARGYLNRPDLTAERFVPDPFAAAAGVADARMYKTGDLGRRRADGTIEFLGRNDHQVKVRGFRIELGEIEARLREHPAVREVVVLAREDHPGNRRLVAYITGNESPQPEALRAHLAERLPDYMVPAAYVHLSALPLTPNGKLDRRALPAPEDGVTHPCEPPRGELELTLASIWSELLGMERIGRQDDFFELGGHSMLAARLVSRVRDTMEVELLLSQVFEVPVFAQMARAVRLARLRAAVAATSNTEQS